MDKEYRDHKLTERQDRCRVCHAPVEPAELVCPDCSYRHNKEMERERLLYSLDGADSGPDAILGYKAGRTVATRIGNAEQKHHRRMERYEV